MRYPSSMLLPLLTAGLFAPPTVDAIDALAKARNVAGLTALLAPLPAGTRNPFAVLKSGGAYEVGKYGWRAYSLGKDYVVLSTPLTSEDVGEILLRRDGERLAFVPERESLGAKIVRHSIDLRFRVEEKRAEIVDRVALSTKGAGSFVFRMSPAYRVASISDEKGRSVAFTQAGGMVLLKKGPQSLTMRYGGVVNLPQYAGSISDREATLVNDYWYPMIARDPAPYELTVHAPKAWTTVGQGTRVSDEVGATERTTKFRMDLPVVYFSVSSGPYRTVTETIGGRRYTAWSPRLDEERMRAQAETYAPIVEFYNRSFGASPFEGYGALDSPQYGGGALEAYSYATYGGFWGEDPHEPAHTWWGGIINNTYLNSFWNESFAVFSEGLYRRNVRIGNVEERRLAFVSNGAAGGDYNQTAVQEAGADKGPVASSMGYGKGAKVLQMLEQWLGTDLVVGDMREWIATHPKGEPGDWPDFERIVARRAPGNDVKGFFDDWLRRPGYANFDATAKVEGSQIRIDLTWKGPRFRMPLDVMVQSASGARSFTTVWLNGTENPVFVPGGDRPALVSVDPWRRAVRRIGNDEEPVSIERTVGNLPKFVDPAHKDWMAEASGRAAAGALNDPAGKFIVGSPETLPIMRDLCEKAGFKVAGNRLDYDGTTVDLTKGGALAVVDLEGGKRCVIGLGKTRMAPNTGSARTALVDDLGRFLRGKTEPKTEGKLVFRL